MRSFTTVPLLLVVLTVLAGKQVNRFPNMKIRFPNMKILSLSFYLVCEATGINSCFKANKTYPTTGLTHVVVHKETAEECQESCCAGCAGFTWINPESSLLPKICALFNTTDTEIDCEVRVTNYQLLVIVIQFPSFGQNCVSGPKECPCYFSGECDMTEANFVDVQHSVEDVASCHSLCKIFDNENCNHITYYNDKSEFPHLCFLFNDCATNNTDCADGCAHGPRECEFCSWEETKAGSCSTYGGCLLYTSDAADE